MMAKDDTGSPGQRLSNRHRIAAALVGHQP
jgi:hypothetical protein